MICNCFQGMINVLGRHDIVIDPDELLVVEEVANPSWPIVWVRHLKSFTHRSIDVAKERKGQIVFIRKGPLFVDGVH